jgi:hypothetical protein
MLSYQFVIAEHTASVSNAVSAAAVDDEWAQVGCIEPGEDIRVYSHNQKTTFSIV